jgi:hypothetical protein
MHSKILKGLRLEWVFNILSIWVLSLSLSILQISCKFCKRLFKIKKKIIIFWVWIWVSIMIFFLVFKINTQIHTEKIIFFYFKLSFSKFTRDLQKTQTQNSNNQKIENSNPNLNLWVFLNAYVWLSVCKLMNKLWDNWFRTSCF